MKKRLKIVFMIAICAVFGAISINAQNKIAGRYVYEAKVNYDQKSRSYQYLFEVFVELQRSNRAVFTKMIVDVEEVRKIGFWTWNKENQTITATFPPARGADGKKYPRVILTFKKTGRNLRLVRISPKTAGAVGVIYQKL